MINAGLIALMVLVSGITSLKSRAQDVVQLMQQADKLEKAFRDEDALHKYLEALKAEPEQLDALCKTSELYNILGKRQGSKDKQRAYYVAGRSYAAKAFKINPDHAEANFVMAISMGRIALISSGEEKIKAVKEIKAFADRCIRLDPANYKGYHVLGKWHYEVSDLSSVERWLVKITYGGLPQSSLDESINNYEKSKSLNPGFLLNYLELAKAYARKDENSKSAALLNTMLKLPLLASDDAKIKAMGKKMLDELKN